MKKLSLCLALSLAAALAGTRDASAATADQLIHGSSCFNPNPSATIYYTQWGPYNPSSTTGVTVNCPIGLPSFNYTTMYLQLSGWSRNSSANRLSCTINTTGYNGYSLVSNTVMLQYNANSAMTNWTQMAPSGGSWPYITCYIPPNNGNGYSYLSTLYVKGTY